MPPDPCGPGLPVEGDQILRRALADEQRRVRLLARMADAGGRAIRQGKCPDRQAANDLIARLHNLCLGLFPDKGDVFDLIYRPRLTRLVDRRFPMQ